MELIARKEIDVRFSEVDSMGIVWHGSYVKYFEDAREEFGRQYNLGYLRMFEEGFFTPLVKLDFNYKKPLIYGDKLIAEIRYKPTEAAKICFEYIIRSVKDESVMVTGSSVQVFMNKAYELVWIKPNFYLDWQSEHQVL